MSSGAPGRAVPLPRERLARILNSLGEGVVSADATLAIVGMNPVAEHLTGWTEADALGRPLSLVLAFKPDTGAPGDPFGRVLREQRTLGAMRGTLAGARDGRTRPVSVTLAPIRGEGGEPPFEGLVAVVRDVTPELAAEEALGHALRDLRQAMEAMPEPVAVLRDDVLLYANPAWAAALGYEHAEELAGRRLGAAGAGETGGQANREGAGARAAANLRLRHRDGSEVELELAVPRSIRFEGGPAQLSVARNMTERRRAHARQITADRMALVGTLAAGVAHEINNPLAVVHANLRFVAEDLARAAEEGRPAEGAALAELRDAVQEAAAGAERVRVIVRDLNEVCRDDGDASGPVDLRRIVEAAVRLMSAEIRGRARLETAYGEVPPVEASGPKLGQVVLNLLSNAWQAIPAPGTEAPAERHVVRVVTRTDAEGRAVVEVHDTGDGIPRELQGRVFDPYFTTKPQGAGRGLGLSLCHGIVTGAGGEIAFESTPGRGTVFRVALPPSAGNAPHGEAAPGGGDAAATTTTSTTSR
ncbi:MAG TPA: ATP-binding protein [Myxococcota bacterium]|nr:ATP-binding protein [Myxococcota bacterium]